MLSPRILIVEADDPAADSQQDALSLEQQVRASGHPTSRVTVSDSVAFLRRAIFAGEEPLVIVLGPTISSPLPAARQLRGVSANAHFIFAPRSDRVDRLRSELGRTAMIGSHWSMFVPSAGALSKQVSDALRTAQKRIRLRTTLDRANVQISAPRPVDSNEYRRMVLSDHYLANVLTQTQEVIISLNTACTIVYWSAGAARAFGLTAEAAVGTLLRDTPLWSAELGKYLDRVPAAAQALTAELVFSSAGSTLMMETIFSAVRDEQGTFIGASLVMRDVTERKRQLEAQIRMREEAEQLGRLKDDFLATLSHELRTPLNSILGWAQLLQAAHFPQDKMLNGLATIERNALHQARLIEDLLDISSVISGKLRLELKPVRLGGVIENAVTALRPEADRKRLRLSVRTDAENDLVCGDAHRLQQVVWNLLSNAVKFTPEGGAVGIALRQSGSLLQVVVTDTGQGIAPDFMPHLFGRFRQADSSITRRKGGLGLGLSIVKQLVEMHEGSVSASSPGPGFGATLTVTLPLWGADEAAIHRPMADKAGSGAAASLKGTRVLVVDDEPDARELVAALLQNNGAETMTADSAASALEIIEAFDPDLLVSDIGMPGTDGYELLRIIRTTIPKGQGLPAVALTAFAGPASREKAAAAGFQHHIAKPFQASELLAIVANIASRRKIPVKR